MPSDLGQVLPQRDVWFDTGLDSRHLVCQAVGLLPPRFRRSSLVVPGALGFPSQGAQPRKMFFALLPLQPCLHSHWSLAVRLVPIGQGPIVAHNPGVVSGVYLPHRCTLQLSLKQCCHFTNSLCSLLSFLATGGGVAQSLPGSAS